MLPSTGYFRTIQCPFYDMGFCERPFCHFKHREPGENLNSPSIPSSSEPKNEYLETGDDVKARFHSLAMTLSRKSLFYIFAGH